MRRWLLALALACSCARAPHYSYKELRTAYRAGKLHHVRAQLEFEGGAWWRTKPNAEAWPFRLLLCEVLLAQAHYEEALAALRAAGEGPSAELESRRLLAVAEAHMRLNRLAEAKGAWEQGLARASRSGSVDLLLHAMALESRLLSRSGHADQSTAVLHRLIDAATRHGDYYYLAGARINLGYAALRSMQWDEAVTYSREAYLDATRIGAARFAGIAALNLGAAHSHLGNFDDAKQAQQAAIDSTRDTGDRRTRQAALGELGTIYLREGNLVEAATLIERAFHVAREAGLTADASRWGNNLAVTLNMQRDWVAAERWNRTARELAQSDRAALPYLELNESITQIGQGHLDSARTTLLRLRSNSSENPSVAWQVEEALARLAHKAGDVGRSNAHFESALAHIDRAAGQLRQDQFRVTLRARLIGLHREYIDSLLEQGRTDRALEVAESSRAQLLAEKLGRKVATPRARDLLAKAQACRCVLLSYWLSPGRSVVWIVHPRGISVENLPKLADVERAAAAYRRELLDGFEDPLSQPAGTQLAAALIGPVHKYLPPGSRAVVAPDGPMNSINLEALPVGGDPKHYWIEDVTLALAPSLALLEVGRFERPKSALLLGAPTFASPEFPALRHAAEELRTVKTRLSRASSEVYEGAAATPAAYLLQAPRLHSVVHFAAHGDVRYEHPFDSAIVLSGSGGAERLSGRQIAAQPLGAELVTVSACKSAGARTFAGEGLTGLAWTFLQSGARRVIAGSWDVSDQSSTRLVDRLYEGINTGEDPVESLRQSKLTLLNSNTGMRHPFYWAALQIFVRVVEPTGKKLHGQAR